MPIQITYVKPGAIDFHSLLGTNIHQYGDFSRTLKKMSPSQDYRSAKIQEGSHQENGWKKQLKISNSASATCVQR